MQNKNNNKTKKLIYIKREVHFIARKKIPVQKKINKMFSALKCSWEKVA